MHIHWIANTTVPPPISLSGGDRIRAECIRRFARVKKTVHRMVNPAIFADTLPILGARIFPARRQFLERNLIRRIARNLVRGHEDKIGWRVASSKFSVPTAFTSKSTNGISAALPCGAVDDQVKPFPFEEIEDFLAFANVQIQMPEMFGGLFKPFQIPKSVAPTPKIRGADYYQRPRLHSLRGQNK
jgi:hypothetical protein